MSALCRLSGIKFDELSDIERRRINSIPAMIYHGVNTEEAILMRMNSVPRSISKNLGEFYTSKLTNKASLNVNNVKNFLKDLSISEWESVKPNKAKLSGKEYKEIWQILSGNTSNTK